MKAKEIKKQLEEIFKVYNLRSEGPRDIKKAEELNRAIDHKVYDILTMTSL